MGITASRFGEQQPPVQSFAKLQLKRQLSVSSDNIMSLKSSISTLETPEQVTALKRMRERFQRSMSVPAQMTDSLPERNNSENRPRRRRCVTESSAGITSRPYDSLLSTDAERAALRKHMAKQNVPTLPQLEADAISTSEQSESKGFTTRNSRPKKMARKQISMFSGGVCAMLFAARQCEGEFRSRNEGPWGYCNHDHWDGRHWGMADNQ